MKLPGTRQTKTVKSDMMNVELDVHSERGRNILFRLIFHVSREDKLSVEFYMREPLFQNR